MKQKPAVLLVEEIHPDWRALLERHARVVMPADFREETLAALAAAEQVQGIVIRTKGCVSAKVIAASPRLKVVGRHGIGVDHIDLRAAASAGVRVVYTPGASRLAAAEQTWAHILALAKRSHSADRAVRAGDFAFRDRHKSLQLHGKVLGIVGLGRIGATVAEIGVRGFGMRVLYADIVKYPKKERRLGARKMPLRQVLARSDVVTIHTPLDESTRGMIGARQLAWMRPGALLVNCARGAIVDLDALAAALDSGKPAGAGLDVFEPEPLPPGHPLLSHPAVSLSPHFAAQTPEANLGYGAVVEDVLRVLAGQRPRWEIRNR